MSGIVSGADDKMVELLKIFDLDKKPIKSLNIRVEAGDVLELTVEQYVTPEQLEKLTKLFLFTVEMENSK